MTDEATELPETLLIEGVEYVRKSQDVPRPDPASFERLLSSDFLDAFLVHVSPDDEPTVCCKECGC